MARTRPIAQPNLSVRPEVALRAPPITIPQFPPRYFHPGELDVLVHLIRDAGAKTVIEFGCNDGRAAATLLHNLAGIEVYVGIDVCPGHVTTLPYQMREIPDAPGIYAAPDPRFHLIVRPRGSFDLVPSDLPPADAAFIDADHSRLGVMHDFALALAVVRDGGVIVFHDDNGLPEVEVAQTLDELHLGGHQIAHVAGTWLAVHVVGSQPEVET